MLVWSTPMACLQVMWSQGEIRGYMESLSMEVAEPRYPAASTLGNNKGLSLPGVWSVPFRAPQNLCHPQHLLQGNAGGLWLWFGII